MNASTVRERVHLRSVLPRLSPGYLQEVQKERREAGLRFVAKLKRHKLGDLVHRIMLVPVMREDNRYAEHWALDLTSNYRTDMWDWLKPKVEAREDAARVLHSVMPRLFRR